MATEPRLIESAEGLISEDFYLRYYLANRPVLLKGFARRWPAFTTWTPRYFAEAYGDVDVEVMTALTQNRHYERTAGSQSKVMSLRSLIDTIEQNPESGDTYLVAQNHAFTRAGLLRLVHDLVFDDAILSSLPGPDTISLWLGPGNTVTPLHYDLKDVILAQMSGRKRVLLVSPEDSRWVYNEVGGYSEVDPECPNLQTHPLFARARLYAVELKAGDALFIPVRWWHHVRSLSPSISLSLSNFARSITPTPHRSFSPGSS